MTQHAGHTPCGVMLCEAIGGEHVWEARIARRLGVWIIGSFFLARWRIGLMLWINWVAHQRFQRLKMCGKRPILQSTTDIEPAASVWMHAERLITIQSFEATHFQIAFVIGRHCLFAVAAVLAGPLPLFRIPPDKLLALTPWRAVWFCRCAVVENARVLRPCEAPAVSELIFGVACDWLCSCRVPA